MLVPGVYVYSWLHSTVSGLLSESEVSAPPFHVRGTWSTTDTPTAVPTLRPWLPWQALRITMGQLIDMYAASPGNQDQGMALRRFWHQLKQTWNEFGENREFAMAFDCNQQAVFPPLNDDMSVHTLLTLPER